MTGWIEEAAGFERLDADARRRLERLGPVTLPRGTAVFHPGEAAKGFVIVLTGRIDVFLTGPSGRDILLYSVEPGGSCVQTTLGLLGGEDYSGEAVAVTDCRIVLIPRGMFLALMEDSVAFRSYVFAAFATRMQSMMHVLERVAFQRVESRLAAALLERAADGVVHATHQDIATAIGSAREVVSRRLEGFARAGWVTTERGSVRIADAAALRRLAAAAE